MAAWLWIPSPTWFVRELKFWWRATPCSATAILRRMPRCCSKRRPRQHCRKCKTAELRSAGQPLRLRSGQARAAVAIMKSLRGLMSRRVPMILVLGMLLAFTIACTNKKSVNPLANVGSKQPDKVLFDKAMDAMRHNRFDVARLTLQTLINTYPDSEYIAR